MDLTGSRGGGSKQDIRRVLDRLRQQSLVRLPEIAFIPAHRAIVSGTGGEWDLSGRGLVERIDQMKNAAFNQPELKRAFSLMEQSAAELLEVAHCSFNVARLGDNVSLELVVNGEQRPLEDFGTGYEHTLIVIAATIAYPDLMLVIEEPEVHLHPRLQRRLAEHIRDRTSGQVIISTHSAHLIDALGAQIIRVSKDVETNATHVSNPLGVDGVRLLDELGYRASDLLQTNCVVWVEGPSDRTYINEVIRQVSNGELVEGVHYVLMFYGGALLAHASAASPEDESGRVQLRRLQQHFVVVADSDKRAEVDDLKSRVLRLSDEANDDLGYVWVTAGREIESYIPPEVLSDAIKRVHPSVTDTPWTGEQFDDPLQALKTDGEPLSSVDKVAVANMVVAAGMPLTQFDLEEQGRKLVGFIMSAN